MKEGSLFSLQGQTLHQATVVRYNHFFVIVSLSLPWGKGLSSFFSVYLQYDIIKIFSPTHKKVVINETIMIKTLGYKESTKNKMDQ